jgi:hypothetical protein
MGDICKEFGGKKVWLKQTFPLDQFYHLPGLALDVDKRDLRTAIPLLVAVIDRWEFEGNPADEAAYTALDAVDIILPLYAWVDSRMGSGVQAALKN